MIYMWFTGINYYKLAIVTLFWRPYGKQALKGYAPEWVKTKSLESYLSHIDFLHRCALPSIEKPSAHCRSLHYQQL
jgi:hypothetical protein